MESLPRTVKRRNVLKAIAAAGGLSAISLPVSAQSSQFVVEHDGACYEVEPLSYQDEDILEFYDFFNSASHTSTGLEQSDYSFLFLYEDPDGAVSLVALHDEKNDTTGGAVTFEFIDGGLPSGGSWVVQDGPGGPWTDTYSQTKASWSWLSENTDGGAYRPMGSEFDVTVKPRFNENADKPPLDEGEIRAWCFLTGDAEEPNSIHLDLDTNVQVHIGNSSCDSLTQPGDGCLLNIEMDIKPCSDPNAINPDSNGLIPVGIKGSDSFDPASEIRVDSLRFGAPDEVDAGDGAEAAHDGHREDTVPCEGDGHDDLVVHFPTEDTGFESGDDRGKLVGETHDGVEFVVYDSVKIVGGGGGGHGGP